MTVTEDIREWEYGEYEGITSQEIRERRKAGGLGGWDIWRDGCPGGEYVSCLSFSDGENSIANECFSGRGGNRSPEQVMERLDRLIHEIKTNYHTSAIGKPKGEAMSDCDVLVVAHGHILRAFAMRWIDKPLTHTVFLLEAGGVGTLR